MENVCTNSAAIQTLANHCAGGMIETFNAPSKYCIEFSHSAYRNWWRFNLERLPADLIRSNRATVINFGQYPYGAYITARPPFMRWLLPSENDPDYEHFFVDPQEYFISSCREGGLVELGQ
ncbi:UNVERIFIED_CONTAM: Lipoxygenase 6, chloroplastic [Sesamum radiatum]|uniref:Lipoxygenase 6, chloroplastic n=1 Tax=Sesamum radiatum TaxID=300843 RepID=A0AAW2W2G4_SESRA